MGTGDLSQIREEEALDMDKLSFPERDDGKTGEEVNAMASLTKTSHMTQVKTTPAAPTS